MTPENIIRIALTKGRLEKKTLELLEHSGYDVSELRSGSRKLIFRLPNSNIELVLSKAADVITYVEHGVCDMGVVGKDTIMEKGGSFYETLDLGFGKCRFCLCGKKGEDFYAGYHTRTIASKYPKVTRDFFSRKNMDVNIIKIEGSVELAPLLGLADAIVDIVETGTTLKENGLEGVIRLKDERRMIFQNAERLFKQDEGKKASFWKGKKKIEVWDLSGFKMEGCPYKLRVVRYHEQWEENGKERERFM